jgi:hypothetical protein
MVRDKIVFDGFLLGLVVGLRRELKSGEHRRSTAEQARTTSNNQARLNSRSTIRRRAGVAVTLFAGEKVMQAIVTTETQGGADGESD